MRPVAEADRVSLAAGEFTRRGVLWAHGIGMFLTSCLFLSDAFRGAFSHSPVYTRVHVIPGGPFTWSVWPLVSSVLLLVGMTGSRWRCAAAGLLGLAVWYAAQSILVVVGWNKAGQVGLLGPVGVYGLVLFFKAITHAVSIIITGRRYDRE